MFILSPSRSAVFQTTTFCRGHIMCRFATVIAEWPLRLSEAQEYSASLPIRRWANTSLHTIAHRIKTDVPSLGNIIKHIECLLTFIVEVMSVITLNTHTHELS